jgi:hypothetical protein
MRVRGKGATLDAGEGLRSPPLPYLDLDETEALALIGIGLAEAVEDEDEVPAAEPEPEPVVEPVVEPEPVTEPEPVEQASVGADGGASQESEASASDSNPPTNTERQAAIAEVFEILADDDLVKTGPRAGHPKVSAIEAATGLTGITAEEVDALWAARI